MQHYPIGYIKASYTYIIFVFSAIPWRGET